MQYFARSMPLILLMLAALATTAGAGDREVHKLAFDSAHGPVEVVLDSQQTGLQLRALKPGESRTVTAESGQIVTVTRLEDSLALDVGGQRFEIPASHGSRAGHFGPHMKAGLTILSAEPMDDTKRQTISAALSAAGITDQLHFHSADEGLPHQVMIRTDVDSAQEHVVIRKEIELDED